MNPFDPPFDGDLTELARKEEERRSEIENFWVFMQSPMRTLVDQVHEAINEFHVTTGKKPTFVLLGSAQAATCFVAAGYRNLAQITIHGIPCRINQEYESFVGVGF